jgi:aspartate/methionine/tyrosine aminotransferase
MMKLTRNLNRIVPDPVRYWVKVGKDAGAVNNLTIGVPDPIPRESLEVFAKAQHECEMRGATGYPPFDGEVSLKKAIVSMEGHFGAALSEADVPGIYVTVGASQALQFAFSLFDPGTEVIANTPCWGTIYNMVAHSGVKGVPASLFEGGRFVEENAKKALSGKSQAVYINFPSNPTGEIVPEAQLRLMCGWAAAEGLQVISDEPYKYLIYDREKTPYKSPVSFGGDIAGKVSLVSSFSKIVKPDIRLGFIRLSPEIIKGHEMVGFYFRNLSAGASEGVQAGVTALVQDDPTLKFLRPIVDGYRAKSEIAAKSLTGWGCRLPYRPAAAYMMFPTTPDGSDAEDWVRKTAAEKKTAFIPGTSFGGGFKGFEHLKRHFRLGFGGGMTKERLSEVMGQLTGRA